MIRTGRPIMTRPRFSIATFMAAVLVLAVNLAAGDFYYGAPGMEWSTLINFGARPMASILAVGLVPLANIRSRRDGDRLFLTGFEVVGVGALLVYVACALVFTRSIHDGIGNLMDRVFSRGSPLFPWSLMGLLVLPQLFVAWLGGWVNTRYLVRFNVLVERRTQA
jgi:hypothetical protein